MRKVCYSMIVALMLGLTSCIVVPRGQTTKATPAKAAPGQVKKTTGSQSAAPYAPGQQKKAAAPAAKKKN